MTQAEYPHLPALDALSPTMEGMWTVYAVLRKVQRKTTRAGKPYLDVVLADVGASAQGKIWSDAGTAMEAALRAPRGRAMKVLFSVDEYQGRAQIAVRGLREVEPSDPNYDPATVVDPGFALVEDLVCDTLVFDIETVPATDLRRVPSTIAQAVTKAADRTDADEAMVMGLSPYFGRVVSLAVGDGEDPNAPVTVFVVPGSTPPSDPLPPWVRMVSEPELLQAFWALAGEADTVVTYNGRGFDVPFLVGRSLVHGVPVRCDLVSNPFALRPHLDLYQALSGRTRSLGPASLDVVCWALGLTSPKEEMDGSMVATYYAKGDLGSIAKYNAGDVRATAAVYRRVRDDVLRFRGDW